LHRLAPIGPKADSPERTDRFEIVACAFRNQGSRRASTMRRLFGPFCVG
jgi:hypothetical protein